MSLGRLAVDALAATRLTRLVTTDTLPPLERAREAAYQALPPEWAEGLHCTWCVGVWAGLATLVLPRRLVHALAVAQLVGGGFAVAQHLEEATRDTSSSSGVVQ